MDLKALAAKDRSGSWANQFKLHQHEAKKADERKGEKPQAFPDPSFLVKMFQKLPDTRLEFGIQEGKSVTNHMPRPYFPCTKPVHELSHLVIKDLRLETHHPGKRVFIRVMTPPQRIRADGTAVVEDTEGVAVFLQLYQLPEESDFPASSVIWPGRVALIKEPFFSLNALDIPSLRVDHVSNIIWLSNDDDRIPAKWRQGSHASLKSSIALRMEGNEAVKKQHRAQAHSLYSQAIRTASADEELQPARLNRSLANLKLGHFEDALADASDQAEPSSEKVLFRSAQALYELRR
ncbi:TPR domain protein [Sarocladium implicatum]|nr:TPR domain protein [Sarocladium implicatum]